MRKTVSEAVEKHPGDLDALRVYADALLEDDDPRGEAIQIACELETLPLCDPKRAALAWRYDELVARHRRQWLPARTAKLRVELFRGLPRHLSGDTDAVIAAMPEMKPLAISLDLFRNDNVAAILAQPAFEKLVRLDLGYERDDMYAALFAAPNFPALQELAIVLGAPGARAMAACRRLDGLRKLSIHASSAKVDDIAPLLERTELHVLELSRLPVGAAGVQTIAKHCKQLRKLVLDDCDIDNAAAEQIASGFQTLEVLELPSNRMTTKGVAALAASKNLATVGRVAFTRVGGSPPFGAKSLAAFADALVWKKLRSLGLGACNIRAEGAALLDAFDKLVELELQGNALGDKGADALARLSLKSLKKLDLDSNTLKEPAMAKLARAKWLPHIEELSLRHNKFGSTGAISLGSAKLAKLRVLQLGHNWIGSTGLRAILEAAPALAVVGEGVNNYNNAEFLRAVLDGVPLRELAVYGVKTKQLDELATSWRLGSLCTLSIRSDALDDIRATKLAANKSLAALGHLDVDAPNLTEVGRGALRERFGARVTFRHA